MLTDHHTKKIKDAGHVPLVPPKFSSTTLNNDSFFLADHENISISASIWSTSRVDYLLYLKLMILLSLVDINIGFSPTHSH